jgi:ribosomal protein L27
MLFKNKNELSDLKRKRIKREREAGRQKQIMAERERISKADSIISKSRGQKYGSLKNVGVTLKKGLFSLGEGVRQLGENVRRNQEPQKIKKKRFIKTYYIKKKGKMVPIRKMIVKRKLQPSNNSFGRNILDIPKFRPPKMPPIW